MKHLILLLASIILLTSYSSASNRVSFLHEHDRGADRVILCSEEQWMEALPQDYKELLSLPKTGSFPRLTPPQNDFYHKNLIPLKFSRLLGESELWWRGYEGSHQPWAETFISSTDLYDQIGVQIIVKDTRDVDFVLTRSLRSYDLKNFRPVPGKVPLRLVSDCLDASLLSLYKSLTGMGFQVLSVDYNRAYILPDRDMGARVVMVPYESIGFTPQEFLLLRQEIAYRESVHTSPAAIDRYVHHTYLIKLKSSGSHLTVAAESSINPIFAAEMAFREKLYPPLPEPDGRVQTLNNMGGMTPVIDAASQAFIDHCVRYSSPYRQALEIGASYGLVAEQVVRQGGMKLVLNDMDYRHLLIFARKLHGLNPDFLHAIELIPGMFPQCFDTSPYRRNPRFFDAILGARIFHFMKPEQLKPALNAVYDLLDTGGVFFAVMLTPYVRTYYKLFMPVFTERKKRGDLFPGYVENLADYADPELIPPAEQKSKGLAQPFMFFDTESAKRILEEVGFVDIEVTYAALPYKSKLWGMPEIGRENVLVKAYKPTA